MPVFQAGAGGRQLRICLMILFLYIHLVKLCSYASEFFCMKFLETAEYKVSNLAGIRLAYEYRGSRDSTAIARPRTGYRSASRIVGDLVQ